MSIVGFAGEIFFEDKVVAHFKDGRVVKGHTRDFSPVRDSFTLHPYTGPTGPLPVFLEELKAVFHVRTFDGNPGHARPSGAIGRIEEERFSKVMDEGRRVAIQFNDGERLWGFAESFEQDHQGFFFFPTDPADNNLRIYVVRSSLREMVFLEN
ncbi:MAG TPA: hypothetical protein VFG76_03355 [Candidatus Polarisedimenticolia bacterium]|nr:hypothetical protein [Candidatus Polarisedimenticolia bacterium]